MSKLVWDADGERFYESGTDRGVLFPMANGVYSKGVAWNGLTGVTESPSGAEESVLYADNRKYGTMRSAEEFGATVEAYTYPDEWAACDGSAELAPGVYAGQQNRSAFGMAYRSKIGNDATQDLGYKLHLMYGATASPSEKAYATVNDSPEAITFSWEVTTNPVNINDEHKPTALLTIDSRTADATKLAALEAIIYGTNAAGEVQATEPRLPLPAEVMTLMTA